ncbi:MULTISPECIES: DUF6193 family natural product biosynthesis protein [unclassified Streptomyces]|uniref:DUF6193 family natural product biosynthesis protein n=1 Tax=unclassified Streptomyces TaxID=2593676 RepID=UPI0004BE582B|nr:MULTISPECIES: DUF6193 family natural product biosynthesis protein [unclassified Streptomyces]
MATPPEPSVLYSEIEKCGSLAAALRREAGGALAAVPVTSPDSAPLLHASVPSTVAHREPLRITAWSHERRWAVDGAEPFQGLSLICGRTGDLAQIARAARGWHDGAALDDIRRAAPFVHLTGRFEVPDRDPVGLAESEWRGMLKEARELEYAWRESYQALIEAAYAEPALRALYPFTSHWALRFSATIRPNLAVVGPCLTAGGDGTYGVGRGFLTPDLGLFATADEAVAMAVRGLPSGLGRVGLGDYAGPR